MVAAKPSCLPRLTTTRAMRNFYRDRVWVEDIMWGNNLTQLTVREPTSDGMMWVQTWVRGATYGTATYTSSMEPLHDRTANSVPSDS